MCTNWCWTDTRLPISLIIMLLLRQATQWSSLGVYISRWSTWDSKLHIRRHIIIHPHQHIPLPIPSLSLLSPGYSLISVFPFVAAPLGKWTWTEPNLRQLNRTKARCHGALPSLPGTQFTDYARTMRSDAVIAPWARGAVLTPGLHSVAAVRMWSHHRSVLPEERTGEEDEMFFTLPPVPLSSSEHHPFFHLPHRR